MEEQRGCSLFEDNLMIPDVRDRLRFIPRGGESAVVWPECLIMFVGRLCVVDDSGFECLHVPV